MAGHFLDSRSGSVGLPKAFRQNARYGLFAPFFLAGFFWPVALPPVGDALKMHPLPLGMAPRGSRTARALLSTEVAASEVVGDADTDSDGIIVIEACDTCRRIDQLIAGDDIADAARNAERICAVCRPERHRFGAGRWCQRR